MCDVWYVLHSDKSVSREQSHSMQADTKPHSQMTLDSDACTDHETAALDTIQEAAAGQQVLSF